VAEFTISSSKKQEVVDITEQVKEIVMGSKVKEGICVIYTPHATAAIIINENWDPNISLDFLDSLNALIPIGKWRHDKVDGNGSSHIKAAIVGPSETIPITAGKLDLGQWQNIMLADFDGPRNSRKIIVKIISSA
jgi:secondary thiamine-phosphate synthase enzyme